MKPANRERSGFRLLSHLFRIQGGLCSICGAQMELVNPMEISKPERKRLRKAGRLAMMATIDHTIPRSVARGVQSNRRAAHNACNESKGSRLLEPFPLPCFDLPSIKLPSGQRVPMRPLTVEIRITPLYLEFA